MFLKKLTIKWKIRKIAEKVENGCKRRLRLPLEKIELNMTTFSLLLLDDICITIYSYFRRIGIMKIR